MYSVAVYQMVVAHLTAGFVRRREHETNFGRCQHILGEVPVSRFQPRIGYRFEAETFPPVIRGLYRIADPPMHMINAIDLEKISLLIHWTGFCTDNFCHFEIPFAKLSPLKLFRG